MNPIIFKFDMLPPNANEYARMHWANRKRIMEAWEWHIIQQLSEIGVQVPAPGESCLFYKVRIKTKMTVKRRRDDDNAMAMLKIPVDALRHQRVLYNDSKRWCEMDKPIQEIGKEESFEMQIIPEQVKQNANRTKKERAPRFRNGVTKAKSSVI